MSEPFGERLDRFIKKLQGVKPQAPDAPEKRLFATFQDRAVASVIDTAIIYVLLQDVFNYITAKTFSQASPERIQQAFANRPVDVAIPQAIRFQVNAFFESGLINLWLINSFIQSIIVGVILVLVWREFHCTPGKYIFGLEFAGKNGEGKPTTKQYIGRFAGFFLSMPPFMLGFAALGLDKQKRAWHDRLAGTTVIYSERGSVFRQGWNWMKRKFKKG